MGGGDYLQAVCGNDTVQLCQISLWPAGAENCHKEGLEGWQIKRSHRQSRPLQIAESGSGGAALAVTSFELQGSEGEMLEQSCSGNLGTHPSQGRNLQIDAPRTSASSQICRDHAGKRGFSSLKHPIHCPDSLTAVLWPLRIEILLVLSQFNYAMEIRLWPAFSCGTLFYSPLRIICRLPRSSRGVV